MSYVNIMLGRKGGIGKTTACLAWAEARLAEGRPVACFDTDANQRGLSSFERLQAQYIEVAEETETGEAEVQEWRHNALYDEIEKLDPAAEVMVDTGGSNFIAAQTWMRVTDAPETLKAYGRELRIHTVIPGGSEFQPCLVNLQELVVNFPDVPLVVWVNPYLSKAEKNGKTFETTATYKKVKDNIEAVINIPRLNEGSRELVTRIFASRQMLGQALESEELKIYERPRLKNARAALIQAVSTWAP